MPTDHTPLLDALCQEYEEKFVNSARAHARAREVLVDGVSHGARLFEPYPFRVQRAEGTAWWIFGRGTMPTSWATPRR